MTAPPWWEPFTDVVPDWFRTYLTVEPAASVISTHEAQFLPGLFQTADYARAVIGLAHPDPVAAERRVELRLARQGLLDRPGSPDISAVIGAEALRPPPLPPQQWRAQLDRLIELTERPRVRILISAATPVPPVAEPSFTLLRFPDDAHRDLVYVEHLDDARYLDDPAEVARYCDVLAELSAPERTVAETRAVLHRLHAQVS